MWEVLGNINVLLAIIVSCITIIGAIIATVRFLKISPQTRHQPAQLQSSSTTSISANTTPPSQGSAILYGLDFWDKATVIGEGILWGLMNGVIALGITLLILFGLPTITLIFSIIFHLTNMSRAMVMPTFWTIAIIAGITGLIVGLMVGVVSGVNETKSSADSKRSYNNRRRPSVYFNPFSYLNGATRKDAEPAIPKAPLMKPTTNLAIDRLYEDFRRQIESQFNQFTFTGALIIYTEDDQYGGVVSLADHRMWVQFPEQRNSLIGTKHAYIKSHWVRNQRIHAAVFKDLSADKAYVIWSDKKQPALVVVSPGEVTTIDWR